MNILSEAGRNRHGQKLVRAECDCGNVFTAREDSIKSGRTKSCGNCVKKPAKKSAQKLAQAPVTEVASEHPRGSVAWLVEQIESKERAAITAEIHVKNLQQQMAASEETDLELLKRWNAESTAFEKLNQQIARLQTQKSKTEAAVTKDTKSAAELTKEKIATLRGTR
jgi:hypothetical protein